MMLAEPFAEIAQPRGEGGLVCGGLVAISFLSFVLIQLPPGTPIGHRIGSLRGSAETERQQRWQQQSCPHQACHRRAPTRPSSPAASRQAVAGSGQRFGNNGPDAPPCAGHQRNRLSSGGAHIQVQFGDCPWKRRMMSHASSAVSA